MSRVGKKPIEIPQGVQVHIEGQQISVKGPKGELSFKIRPEIAVELHDNKITVTVQRETKQSNAFWGLTRALIANMVTGVTQGFEKKLQIEGIGFKANVENGDLVLQVGFSHDVRIAKQPGIDFKVEKNIITISGPDRGLVGQIAAETRAVKKPEPYKGTGIRYVGEVVRKKAGKKAVATTGG